MCVRALGEPIRWHPTKCRSLAPPLVLLSETVLKVRAGRLQDSSLNSASRPAFFLSLPPGVTATQNEHPSPLSDVLLLFLSQCAA